MPSAEVLIIGGTGQVGTAVVRALVAEPSCTEVVMVNRKAIPLTAKRAANTGRPRLPMRELPISLAASTTGVFGPFYIPTKLGSDHLGRSRRTPYRNPP